MNQELNSHRKILSYLISRSIKKSNTVYKLFRDLYFNKNEMTEMFKDKMIFGSHGCNHERWNYLKNINLNSEISNSIQFFKKNKIYDNNFSISYPYGGYNNKVINVVKKYNIKFCLTTEVDSVNKLNIKDRYMIPRYDTNDFLI